MELDFNTKILVLFVAFAVSTLLVCELANPPKIIFAIYSGIYTAIILILPELPDDESD